MVYLPNGWAKNEVSLRVILLMTKRIDKEDMTQLTGYAESIADYGGRLDIILFSTNTAASQSFGLLEQVLGSDDVGFYVVLAPDVGNPVFEGDPHCGVNFAGSFHEAPCYQKYYSQFLSPLPSSSQHLHYIGESARWYTELSFFDRKLIF